MTLNSSWFPVPIVVAAIVIVSSASFPIFQLFPSGSRLACYYPLCCLFVIFWIVYHVFLVVVCFGMRVTLLCLWCFCSSSGLGFLLVSLC